MNSWAQVQTSVHLGPLSCAIVHAYSPHRFKRLFQASIYFCTLKSAKGGCESTEHNFIFATMPSSFFTLFVREATQEPSTGPTSENTDVLSTIGLLSTPELGSVIAECKSQVARIAKRCKTRNMRYRCVPHAELSIIVVEVEPDRDADFDLAADRGRCLNGLIISEAYTPSDVQRVTELFQDAEFFSDSPYSNEIIQGHVANCWFISALAATSTVNGLVEKYCVAVSLGIIFSSHLSTFIIFSARRTSRSVRICFLERCAMDQCDYR